MPKILRKKYWNVDSMICLDYIHIWHMNDLIRSILLYKIIPFSQHFLDGSWLHYGGFISDDIKEKGVIIEIYRVDYFKPDDKVEPIEMVLNEHNKQLIQSHQNSLL